MDLGSTEWKWMRLLGTQGGGGGGEISPGRRVSVALIEISAKAVGMLAEPL